MAKTEYQYTNITVPISHLFIVSLGVNLYLLSFDYTFNTIHVE